MEESDPLDRWNGDHSSHSTALFPLLGIAGIELFVAESPGPTADKIHHKSKKLPKGCGSYTLVLQ